MAARQAHNLKVVGSIPTSATKQNKTLGIKEYGYDYLCMVSAEDTGVWCMDKSRKE